MSTDFRDASERHFEDGLLLEAQGRLANADHLFGVSAECSLKAVMIGLGHPPASGGWPVGYQNHINQLLSGFQSWAYGLLDAKYAVHVPPATSFSSWDVGQRYWGRHHFTIARVTSHKNASDGCRSLLKELVLDGVL